MSTDEIRFWLTELRRRGWGMRVLGRTMRLSNECNIWRKADGSEWIYRSEQLRMSRQLERINSGELVCIPGEGGVKGGTRRAGKAVLAAHIVPLTSPLKMAYDLRLGRLKQVPAYEPPKLRLPDFEALANNPRPWRGK